MDEVIVELREVRTLPGPNISGNLVRFPSSQKKRLGFRVYNIWDSWGCHLDCKTWMSGELSSNFGGHKKGCTGGCFLISVLSNNGCTEGYLLSGGKQEWMHGMKEHVALFGF